MPLLGGLNRTDKDATLRTVREPTIRNEEQRVLTVESDAAQSASTSESVPVNNGKANGIRGTVSGLLDSKCVHFPYKSSMAGTEGLFSPYFSAGFGLMVILLRYYGNV